MSKANGEVVTRVRQAVEAARQAGEPAPGRPTLVRLTGATDHAVRKALAELAIQEVGRVDLDTTPTADAAAAVPVGASPDELSTNAGDSDNRTVEPGDRSVTNSPAVPSPGGRLVAWAGFVFGSVMSIAANVLHAWLPAGQEPTGWSPGVAPQIGAAVWPVGLMLAVEALSRIRWPKGLGWGLARFGGAGAVAVGSALISYGHLRDVLLAWSYGPLAAAVGPLVLDGLMVVCGFALSANSRTSAGAAGSDGR